MSKLKEHYSSSVKNALYEKLGFGNVHQVPKLEKIVVSVGAGEAAQNNGVLDHVSRDLILITGRKPIKCKAKHSIAGFKLREGMFIGLMVTLRSYAMYDFLYRLINVAIPRIRDFKGVSSKSFDSSGNLTFGIREQIVFPEVTFDQVDKIRGLGISFVTSTSNTEHSKELLNLLGLPFRKS